MGPLVVLVLFLFSAVVSLLPTWSAMVIAVPHREYLWKASIKNDVRKNRFSLSLSFGVPVFFCIFVPQAVMGRFDGWPGTVFKLITWWK